MNKHILSMVCIGWVLLFSSCEKVTPLMHTVQGEDFNWTTDYIPSGKKVRLKMVAKSEDVALQRMVLQSYDEENGDVVVLDTLFTHNEQSVSFYQNYTCPTFATDTVVIRFTSQIQAVDGQKLSYRFELHVLPLNAKLRTLDAVSMYSALSGKKYAFSLTDFNTFFPDTVPNKGLYFYDRIQQDTARLDVLSHEWASNSGLYFARFESFDYAEATVANIQRAYAICKRDSIVQNIQNDDVLLFGTQADALGVMKVLFVADEEKTENDRYVFSIKTFYTEENK